MTHIKKIITVMSLALFVSATAFSQQAIAPVKSINHFAFILTGGSGSVSKDISTAKQFTFGTLGISYKYNSKINFGVNMLGANDAEEDDSEEMESGDETEITSAETSDEDNIEQEDEEGDEFDLGNFANSVMVNASYFPLDKHTLILQPNLGYSLENNSAAYSVFTGWNQNIFKGLAVMGGIRYFGNVNSGTNPSLKAELGLTWNL